MPKAPLLPDTDIAARLRALRDWRREGDTIVKVFTFANFREALGFVNRIAGEADKQNHHPDVSIHWDTVTLTLWTHASGGLTERDFRLASAIDALTIDTVTIDTVEEPDA